MRCATVCLALAFVATATAVAPAAVNPPGGWGWGDHYPAYRTSYGVSSPVTGDRKSQQEERDGGFVRGSYQVVQPDGVLRVVNYVSSPGAGFQANVINSGVSAHPGWGWGWNNLVRVAPVWGAGGRWGVARGYPGAGVGLGAIRGYPGAAGLGWGVGPVVAPVALYNAGWGWSG